MRNQKDRAGKYPYIRAICSTLEFTTSPEGWLTVTYEADGVTRTVSPYSREFIRWVKDEVKQRHGVELGSWMNVKLKVERILITESQRTARNEQTNRRRKIRKTNGEVRGSRSMAA